VHNKNLKSLPEESALTLGNLREGKRGMKKVRIIVAIFFVILTIAIIIYDARTSGTKASQPDSLKSNSTSPSLSK
jgi:hypothetical protein